jgi:hypothetical protein
MARNWSSYQLIATQSLYFLLSVQQNDKQYRFSLCLTPLSKIFQSYRDKQYNIYSGKTKIRYEANMENVLNGSDKGLYILLRENFAVYFEVGSC